MPRSGADFINAEFGFDKLLDLGLNFLALFFGQLGERVLGQPLLLQIGRADALGGTTFSRS